MASRALLAMVVVAAVALGGCGEDSFGQDETAQTERPCTALGASPGAPLAYFAPFEPVEHEVLCLLDQAQHEVLVAHYNIRRHTYLEKLVALKERGVDVRVAVDQENANKDHNVGDDFLEAHGIPLVRTRPMSSALMHLKVTVIDQTWAMTGSFNWNGTAALANDENMVVFRDPPVVEAYRQEVREVLGEVPKVKQGGVLSDEVELYFVPEVKVSPIIVQQIADAQTSVDVAMFTFTELPIRDALIAAIGRGVRVRFIIEGDRAGAPDKAIEAAGGYVLRAPNLIGEFSAMHHKYAIIDGKRVITGATNWTYSGTNRNAEDLAILRDEALVARYQQSFADLLWVYAGVEDDVAPSDDVSPTLFNAIEGDTQWGDRVVVVGNHPAVGDWNPQAGIALDTSDSMFPSWTAAVDLPAGTRLEYKFVIRRSDGSIRWEGGPNRVLETPATGRAYVTTGWFGDTSVNLRPIDR